MIGDTPPETPATGPGSDTAGAKPDTAQAENRAVPPPNPGDPHASEAEAVSSHGHGKEGFMALAIGSIGVVFGDIGTSPLYAMREALFHTREGTNAELAIKGVISLVFWALIMVVTLKYVIFLMKADNKGEGGTLALMALTQKALGKYSPTVFFLGICGAALFYGEASSPQPFRCWALLKA